MNYKAGDKVYIIASKIFVREAVIIRVTHDYCTIKFSDTGGGMRIRKNRLYRSKEEAEAIVLMNKSN